MFLRSDDEIRRDVLADLTTDGHLLDGIQVDVRGGVVLLEGDIPDETRAGQIEEIASAVDGVVAVRSRIRRVPGAEMP